MYTITWKNKGNGKQEIYFDNLTDACLVAAAIACNHDDVQVNDSNGNIVAPLQK